MEYLTQCLEDDAGYLAERPDEDMPLSERQRVLQQIQEARNGRVPVAFFNFDRPSIPRIPGLETVFAFDTKEPLFRVLKETLQPGEPLDLILYTRGGETSAVWPIVSILREFDPNFEVLVPFRCHSAGTLVALGAKKVVMTPLAELSPIDPSTGNQFNPPDPLIPGNRLAISVEDVQAFRDFILQQFEFDETSRRDSEKLLRFLEPHIERLTERVEPLALGNVHRVLQQIRQLATWLLSFHTQDGAKVESMVKALTTEFQSHIHMINRHEAKKILGEDRVESAGGELPSLLDRLLRGYEVRFLLRRHFFVQPHMGDEPMRNMRFLGASIESAKWGYLYETLVAVRQESLFPANVQLQLPAGQSLPLVPGLPRKSTFEMLSQGWVRNKDPRGFTR